MNSMSPKEAARGVANCSFLDSSHEGELCRYIEDYTNKESNLEKLLKAQDIITQNLMDRISGNHFGARDEHNGQLEISTDITARTGFHEFSQRVFVARRIRPTSAASAKRQLATSMSLKEVREIQKLDERIRSQRLEMGRLEQSILEMTPSDCVGAIKKLGFVARLMLDSVDLEVDYFAYQIEECVAFLELRCSG